MPGLWAFQLLPMRNIFGRICQADFELFFDLVLVEKDLVSAKNYQVTF
jgi:hypothetical protein